MNAAKATQEALIDLYARELRLPGLRKAYRELARDAAQSGQDHVAYLAACLTAEVESRRQSRLQRRLHLARFPALKTLDSFDFTALPDLPKTRVLQLALVCRVPMRDRNPLSPALPELDPVRPVCRVPMRDRNTLDMQRGTLTLAVCRVPMRDRNLVFVQPLAQHLSVCRVPMRDRNAC